MAKGRPIQAFFPDIPFNLQVLLFNTWVPGIPVLAYFTYELFPQYFSKRFAQFLAVFGISFFLYALFSEPRDYLRFAIAGQILGAILGIYTIYIALRALLANREGALLFGGGILIFVVTAIHDMLLSRALVNSVPLGALGLFSFILFQSFLLAQRFSNAFFLVEVSEQEIRRLSDDLRTERDHVVNLNENLEQRVEEQTRDIRSFMTHIQLGIFAITDDHFKIHKDYSEHLKQLFGIADLADMNACELLFNGSHLTSDQVQQAISALDASLGEDSLAFETNRHCLPTELRFQEGNAQERILEISWNPIVDAADTVEKILVTARDVTQLRSLEAKARDKDEELMFIGELLNVPAEAFRRFITNCHDFIAENRNLINSGSIARQDMEALKVMFINMHTMKGAARSLYLKKMTQIFHEVEQYYAQLQKNPGVQWDVTRMNQDLDEVEAIVASYESINRDKLGRETKDQLHVEIPEQDVMTIYRNLTTIGDQIVPSVDSAAQSLIKTTAATVFNRLFTPAATVLADICTATKTLAKDLNKLEPTITIEDQNFYLTHKAEEILRKVFIHLLRNSMDHGLESAAERTQLGKPPAGCITIHLQLADDYVQIIYRDDGRGLDISKIRQVAIARELIDETQNLSPQDIAALIFSFGVSTAGQVSDISGRGVGMDAIKKYLNQVGGDIEIQLEQGDQPEDHRLPAIFLMTLPRDLFATAAPASDQDAA